MFVRFGPRKIRLAEIGDSYVAPPLGGGHGPSVVVTLLNGRNLIFEKDKPGYTEALAWHNRDDGLTDIKPWSTLTSSRPFDPENAPEGPHPVYGKPHPGYFTSPSPSVETTVHYNLGRFDLTIGHDRFKVVDRPGGISYSVAMEVTAKPPVVRDDDESDDDSDEGDDEPTADAAPTKPVITRPRDLAYEAARIRTIGRDLYDLAMSTRIGDPLGTIVDFSVELMHLAGRIAPPQDPGA